jgi:hypothetical protein
MPSTIFLPQLQKVFLKDTAEYEEATVSCPASASLEEGEQTQVAGEPICQTGLPFPLASTTQSVDRYDVVDLQFRQNEIDLGSIHGCLLDVRRGAIG